MQSVSDRLLGMELSEAEALLQSEGVAFVVKYTESDRKKDLYKNREEKHRVVRVIKTGDEQELIVCII